MIGSCCTWPLCNLLLVFVGLRLSSRFIWFLVDTLNIGADNAYGIAIFANCRNFQCLVWVIVVLSLWKIVHVCCKLRNFLGFINACVHFLYKVIFSSHRSKNLDNFEFTYGAF
jgi:hypothetical protein